jgi:hypothetical protein
MTWDLIVSLVASAVAAVMSGFLVRNTLPAAVLTLILSLLLTIGTIAYLSHGHWVAGVELVRVAIAPIFAAVAIFIAKRARHRSATEKNAG